MDIKHKEDKIKKILDKSSLMFLALNSSNESSQIHYDEKDVMNAIHILR
jgi:hypothetical protein